jgi:hypothetical protein
MGNIFTALLGVSLGMMGIRAARLGILSLMKKICMGLFGISFEIVKTCASRLRIYF